MKILPSDKPFSLIIRVSYVYVKFRLNGYILFPLENSNGFIHIPNTTQVNVDTLKFEIPILDEFTNIKRYSTATIVARPDNYEQELVNIDYRLINKSEKEHIKLSLHIEESLDINPEIIIDMNVNNEQVENDTKVNISMDMIIEEEDET